MIEKTCDVCGKHFGGHTSKQVDTQIAVHKMSKHNGENNGNNK